MGLPSRWQSSRERAAACVPPAVYLEGFSWQPCLSPSQIQALLRRALAQEVPAKVPTTRTEGSSIPGAPEAVERPEHQTVSGLVRMHVSEGNVILVSFFFFFLPTPSLQTTAFGMSSAPPRPSSQKLRGPPPGITQVSCRRRQRLRDVPRRRCCPSPRYFQPLVCLFTRHVGKKPKPK